MRLPFSTLVLSATALFSFFPSPTLSIHPHALSHREHGRSPASLVLTSRQHRIARDLLDVCINANVNLAANASQLLGLGTLLGDLDLGTNVQLCLCLKDLNLYLDTNGDVQALVGLLGKNVVSAIVTALINTSPDARQCSFPSNAHHTCNNSDPCHYECDTNYVQNGNTCVCAPPNVSCNGVCGSFPQGCGSSVPSLKRSEPVNTLSQAQERCKPHEKVCGVPGQVGTLAFECVSVAAAKDSCGGCVVPHSFTQESSQTLGKDCTNILNAKSSTCFENQCIVNSCHEGWTPNSKKDRCIPIPGSSSRMLRVRKRGDPLSVNATATANVNSDLLTQLLAIVNTVVDLSSLASSSGISSKSTSNTTSTIYALLGDINRATGSLLSSSTVSQLESNTAALLNTSTLLASILSTCDCTKTLGLTGVSAELQSLVSYLLALTSWYTQNAIVPGSNVSNTGSSSVNHPNQTIVLGLSGLLSELGLSGTSEGVNTLLHNVGLGAISLSPSDATNVYANATIGSDLITQIIALVDLVVKLRDDASSTASSSPPPPSPSSSSIGAVDLINPIIIATSNLVNSTTVVSLVDATESLIQVCSVAKSSLGLCGLEGLITELEDVTLAALGIRSYFQSHPIVTPPTPTAPTASPPAASASTLGNTPIVVGLSDLLTGLQLLGPVKANVTVGVLGSGVSDVVNNLLNGLDIGPDNGRRGDVSANVSSAISSELGTQLAGLIDLVFALQDSMSSLPTPDATSSTSLNSQSVLGVVHAAGRLFQSSTVGALLSNIDALINATSTLQNQFTACSCTEELGLEKAVHYLTLVSDAAVGLKSWCASNDIVAPTADVSTTSPGALSTGGPLAIASHAASSAVALSPVSADTPIVIGLNNLLDGLGLENSTGVATVDGLGDGVDSSVNNLLDGLAGIGPSGTHRRSQGSQQDLMKAKDGVYTRRQKRQILATANATVDATLLAQIDALVDLVLGLNSAGSSLPPTISLPSTTQAIGKSTSTASRLVPTSVPSSISSVSSGSNSSSIVSSLVDGIIEATIALLSCQTYDNFVAEIDTLLAQSINAAETLGACNCTQDLGLDDVYHYLVEIVDSLLGLQDLIGANSPPSSTSASQSSPHSSMLPQPTPSPSAGTTKTGGSGSASSGDEPLVVGLTKLLNGLGINGKTDVVVDGLLGNGLDHTLNSVLDGLGIGPSGA